MIIVKGYIPQTAHRLTFGIGLHNEVHVVFLGIFLYNSLHVYYTGCSKYLCKYMMSENDLQFTDLVIVRRATQDTNEQEV